MPVEIRELTIKINLDNAENQGGGAAGGGNSDDAQKALVEACVEKVLEILKEKTDR